MNSSTTALFGVKLDHSTSRGDGKGAYQLGGTKTHENWKANLHYRNLVFREPLSTFYLAKASRHGNAEIFVVSPLAFMRDEKHAIAIKLKEHEYANQCLVMSHDTNDLVALPIKHLLEHPLCGLNEFEWHEATHSFKAPWAAPPQELRSTASPSKVLSRSTPLQQGQLVLFEGALCEMRVGGYIEYTQVGFAHHGITKWYLSHESKVKAAPPSTQKRMGMSVSWKLDEDGIHINVYNS